MKKKFFLALLVSVALMCLFAISVSAANEVTVIVDGQTQTVNFEDVFNLDSNKYVSGFKDSNVYGMGNVQDVIFPETIAGFNSGAKSMFKGSTVIKSITFKGTSVDMYNCESIFQNSSIESVIFEQGHDCVLNVHDYTKNVFSGCTSLTTIKFPTFTKLKPDGSSDGGDAMGGMFTNCSNMVSQNDIVFAEGVTCLGGQQIFENCSSLVCEVYFPSTIVTINHRSFRNTGITAVHFNNSSALTTIGGGGSEGTFSSCPNLKTVDFTGCTSLKTICTALFNGNTALENVIGLDDSVVETIPSSAFNGCTALKSVPLPSSVVTIQEKAFNGCVALSGTYKLPNLKTVSKEAFLDAGKNDGCYLNLNLPNVVTIGQRAFTNAGVKSLSLSEEFTYDSNNWNTFMGCTKLEYADLSMCTTEEYPACFFTDCTSLKVVVLNNNVKTIAKQMFAGCTSLEFLYLPDSVTSFSTNTEWNKGSFYNCTSLYFVSKSYSIDSFVTDGLFDQAKYNQNKPAKERIYYFPANITGLSQCFRGCSNMNEVIVIGENVTSFKETSIYGLGTNNSSMAIVFLGEMTNFTHEEAISTKVDIIMPNTTEATLTTVKTGSRQYNGSAIYLCKTGRKCTLGYNSATWSDEVNHFIEKVETTEATCLLPAGSFTYCFCGVLMSEETVPGSVALGHNAEGAEYTVYFVNNNYFQNAKEAYNCVRCSEKVETEIEDSALFSSRGYSKSEGAIVFGVVANLEAIEYYNTRTDNDLQYGLVASPIRTDGKQLITSDGNIQDATVLRAEFRGTKYSILQMKIVGIPADSYASPLHCCAYVIENTTVSYLYTDDNKNGVVGTQANQITYSQIN